MDRRPLQNRKMISFNSNLEQSCKEVKVNTSFILIQTCFNFYQYKVDFTLAITLVLRNSGDSIREKLCEVRLDNLQFIKIKPTSQFRYATHAFIF